MTTVNNSGHINPLTLTELDKPVKKEEEKKRPPTFESFGQVEDVDSPFEMARAGSSAAEKLIQGGVHANNVPGILKSSHGERIAKALEKDGVKVVCSEKTTSKTVDKKSLAKALESVKNDDSEMLNAMLLSRLQSTRANREIEKVLMAMAGSFPNNVVASLIGMMGSIQTPEAKALLGSCLQLEVAYAQYDAKIQAKNGNTEAGRILAGLSGSIPQSSCNGECNLSDQHIENLTAFTTSTTEVTTQTLMLVDPDGNVLTDEFGDELCFEHTTCEESIVCEEASEHLDDIGTSIKGNAAETQGDVQRIKGRRDEEIAKQKTNTEEGKKEKLEIATDKVRLASTPEAKQIAAAQRSTAKTIASA